MMAVEADEEPMLRVQIEGKQTPMLVDIEATHTCASPKYATHLPMSNRFFETVGFLGQKQLIQMENRN